MQRPAKLTVFILAFAVISFAASNSMPNHAADAIYYLAFAVSAFLGLWSWSNQKPKETKLSKIILTERPCAKCGAELPPASDSCDKCGTTKP